MANARECDRCGKVYGEQKSIIIHPLEVWCNGEKTDLCPSCERDLESFYNYEFKEIEEIKKLMRKKNK